MALSAGYAQKPPLLPGPRCPDRSGRLLGRLVASAPAPYLALHGHPWDTPRRPFSRRKENPSPFGVREPAARPAASPLPSAQSVPAARPPAAPQPPPTLPPPSLRPGCPLRPDHPPRRLPRVLQGPLPRLAAAARRPAQPASARLSPDHSPLCPALDGATFTPVLTDARCLSLSGPPAPRGRQGPGRGRCRITSA